MVPALMLLRGGEGSCCVHRCGVSSVDSTECLTFYLPPIPPKGLFPRPCAFRQMLLWNIMILSRALAKRDPKKNKPGDVKRVICIGHKALVDQPAIFWLFALSVCLSVCGEV